MMNLQCHLDKPAGKPVWLLEQLSSPLAKLLALAGPLVSVSCHPFRGALQAPPQIHSDQKHFANDRMEPVPPRGWTLGKKMQIGPCRYAWLGGRLPVELRLWHQTLGISSWDGTRTGSTNFIDPGILVCFGGGLPAPIQTLVLGTSISHNCAYCMLVHIFQIRKDNMIFFQKGRNTITSSKPQTDR